MPWIRERGKHLFHYYERDRTIADCHALRRPMMAEQQSISDIPEYELCGVCKLAMYDISEEALSKIYTIVRQSRLRMEYEHPDWTLLERVVIPDEMIVNDPDPVVITGRMTVPRIKGVTPLCETASVNWASCLYRRVSGCAGCV